MNTEPADPPQDVDALRQALASMRDELDAKSQEIVALKLLIAKLRRMQFGRASEKLAGEIDQLELALEALQIEAPAAPTAASAAPVRTIERKPRALPDHLPREERVHMPSCTCQACGAPMRRIGEDVSEQLEFVPARFRVIRHIRPKLACTGCEAMAQSPSRPIVRGLPGPGLLAHVLVSKYADHIPLYRQSEIYAREGVSLERSTMADWVGQCFGLLAPLGEALAHYVLASAKLHADDTPVPVLDPGRGRTKTGRLWTYVRDDRPAGNDAPPAVLFRYSPDRRGERPRERPARLPSLRARAPARASDQPDRGASALATRRRPTPSASSRSVGTSTSALPTRSRPSSPTARGASRSERSVRSPALRSQATITTCSWRSSVARGSHWPACSSASSITSSGRSSTMNSSTRSIRRCAQDGNERTLTVAGALC